MSLIFISHSSQDNAAAADLEQRLHQRDYVSRFLDFKRQGGLAAGADWEKELYHQLKICRALIALCSEASMASKWCFAEIAQAKAMGKRIFPVKISPCTVDPVLTDFQVIDLTIEGEQGYERLWDGLERAGVKPNFPWDARRPPYPGLQAFDEKKDAAIFFGRDEEIDQAMDMLDRMRLRGEPRLVVVLGASGSGKSSLVRAGVLPRLKKDPARWVVVSPFRPGGRPLDEAARFLANAFPNQETGQNWKTIRDRLTPATLPDDPNADPTWRDAAAAAWNEIARDLTMAHDRAEAGVLLVIDQFEELLDASVRPASWAFLGPLRAALEVRGSPLLVLATMRSDFLGAFQNHPALQNIPCEKPTLEPMPAENLPDVIEGPAALANIEIEPGLVEQIVLDTATQDALPLLAFTLRELYERCKTERRFTRAAYDGLGGVQGAVARVAHGIVDVAGLDPETRAALRTAFLRLARLKEGQWVRQPVRWKDLPEAAHPLLEQFVTDRLLVARQENGERVVEIAHEALFRRWETLNTWLEEGREFKLWHERLKADLEDWKHLGEDDGSLLRGESLIVARAWYEQRAGDLSDKEKQFLEASIQAENRRKRQKQVRRYGVVAAGFVAVALIALAFYLQSQSTRNEQIGLARGLAAQAEMIQERDAFQLQRRALLAVEAMHRFDQLGLRSVEADVALRRALQMVPSRLDSFDVERKVAAVAFSPGGDTLTAVLDRASAVKVWNLTTGTEERYDLSEVKNRADLISLSPDGRFLATAVAGTNVNPEGTAQVWEVATGREIGRFPFGGRIWAIALSSGGKYLVLGGLDDEAMSVWDVSARREIGQVPKTTRAVFSPDGQYLATTGPDAGVWEISAGQEGMRLETTYGSPDNVRDVSFSPDGVYMARLERQDRSWSLRLYVLGDEGGGFEILKNVASESVERIVLSRDRQYVALYETIMGGLAGEDFAVWNLLTQEVTHLHKSNNVEDFAFSFRGYDFALAVSNWDTDAVQVWRIDGGTEQAHITVESFDTIMASAFSPHEEDKYLAVVSRSSMDPFLGGKDAVINLQVWDVTTGREIEHQRQQHRTQTVAFSEDGQYLAVATLDGEAQVWTVPTRKRVASFSYQEKALKIALSPDGQTLAVVAAAGLNKNKVWIWDVATGDTTTWTVPGQTWILDLSAERGYLKSEEDRIVNPDGRGERMERLEHVLDLTSGQRVEDAIVLAALRERWDDQTSVRGRYRAGQTAPTTATVWNADDGAEIARIDTRSPFRTLALSQRGLYLATDDGDGVSVWPLQPDSLIDMACRRLSRALTPEEQQRFLPRETAYQPVCAGR